MTMRITVHNARIRLKHTIPENSWSVEWNVYTDEGNSFEVTLFAKDGKEYARLVAFEPDEGFWFSFKGPAGKDVFLNGDEAVEALRATVKKALDNPDTMA